MSALTVDVAYVLSAAAELKRAANNKPAAPATAAAAAAGDACLSSVLPPGVAAVLSHLCQHLAVFQCWNVMHFVVKHLEDAALAAAGAAGAGVPAAAALDASVEVQPAEAAAVNATPPAAPPAGTEEAETLPAPAEFSGSGSSIGSKGLESCTLRRRCPAPATVEYEPDSKPIKDTTSCPCLLGGAAIGGKDAGSSSSSSTHTGIGSERQLLAAKPSAVQASAAAAAAAKEVQSLSSTSKLAASARLLVFGFRSYTLELAYLDSIAAQTFLADVIQAVYVLALGISTSLITEKLQVGWERETFWLALWEAASRCANFFFLVPANFLLLCYRHRLVVRGR